MNFSYIKAERATGKGRCFIYLKYIFIVFCPPVVIKVVNICDVPCDVLKIGITNVDINYQIVYVLSTLNDNFLSKIVLMRNGKSFRFCMLTSA